MHRGEILPLIITVTIILLYACSGKSVIKEENFILTFDGIKIMPLDTTSFYQSTVETMIGSIKKGDSFEKMVERTLLDQINSYTRWGKLTPQVYQLFKKDSTNNSEIIEAYTQLIRTPTIALGGLEELQERVNYPEEAKKNNIEGKVIVICTVTTDGEVKDAKVIKGLGYGCDEAAIEAVFKTKFIPGKLNGIVTETICAIPVIFGLKNSK